jgi:transcriptional regulator with XRE-family HTH domain
VEVVSTKNEVREFLMSRRANVTPAQAGFPDFGGERRVPGLRREEVATLASVSVDYYTRLERGNIRGASDSVLDAIARALQLNDAEREYLFDLAGTAPVAASARNAKPRPRAVRASVQRVLDHMAVPAIVYNANQDIVAANLMGRALYAPLFDADGTPNIARFNFLDPRAQDFYVDWALARRVVAAMMRLEAGRDPLNKELTALIGELSTLSAFPDGLGGPRRARAPPRREVLAPSRGRRHRGRLRRIRDARRGRPADRHLQRPARLRLHRQVRCPRRLGRNPRGRGAAARRDCDYPHS